MKRNIRYILSLLLLFVGVGEAWGQTTDYSGVYYIANNNTNTYILDATTNWYLVPASNGGDNTVSATAWQWNNDANTPLVTTFQTQKDTNSLWKIVKEGDYYYIIHFKTSMYLTYNLPVYTNRRAFHLQATADGDNSLFTFTKRDDGSFNINRKGLTSGNCWLNPSKGNKEYYYGLTADGQTEVAGLLGLYNDKKDNGSIWFLEKVSPTIEIINTDQVKITFPINGVTIHYTINGDTPDENSTLYSGTTFTLTESMLSIKAIAYSGGSPSGISTFTPIVYPGDSHSYLVQSVECNDFYMLPGDDDSNISEKRITTSSLARSSMQWCFEGVGRINGYQYYYLKNKETGQYARYYNNGSDVVSLSTPETFNADGTNRDEYKFCIKYYEDATAPGYYIKPLATTYEGGLNKGSGNNNKNIIWITGANNTSARWKFVQVSDGKMPAPTDPFPFTVSDDEKISYYKIGHGAQIPSTYFIIPSSDYANTSSSSADDNMAWFFMEAESDSWSTYYYIVNAVSGYYLYYRGPENSDGTTQAFQTKLFSSSDKDRYQFAVPKTTETNTNGKYYMVPKILKEQTHNEYISVWRDNDNPLKTQKSRENNNTKWTFTSTTFTCEAPVITYDEIQGTASITCPTGGAKIYYVRYTDDTGADPDLTNATIKATLTLYDGTPVSMVGYTYIKAIAARSYDDGSDQSSVTTYGPIDVFKCVKPVISYDSENNKVTITSATENARIYYVIGDGDIDASGEGSPNGVSFSVGEERTIKAVAVLPGTPISISDVATCAVISSWLSSYALDGYYILTNNFTSSEPIGTETNPFTGTIDGGYNPITLTHPLVGVAQNATIKNVIVGSATISTSGNAGAIANKATGTTRIYNCGVLGGSVSGGTNVGGLVGLIEANSSVRVVNCYNYATVSGGSTMAGIVGKNEGTVGDVRIAMCMMYGDMTGGTSPVYAGNHTSNVSNFTEYNFWRSKANLTYSVYNDQLAIDKDEYLTRFPFYRHILNTHRELAAWFLFGTAGSSVGSITAYQVDEVGHWVLKTEKAPYPIIEKWEKKTKKITVDLKGNLPNTTEDSKGRLLTDMGSGGYLTVNVTINGSSYSSQLPITDMNQDKFDYTWGKVVLPFANEYEVNTDYSKVCTGWKITGVTGGTAGSFEKYNVSDRDCTAKDLFSTTGFIFAQGGNYVVPYGVTAINIEANFATAYYLSDEAYEIGYSGDNSGQGYKDRTALGGSMPDMYHGQTVYHTLKAALSAMSASGTTHSQAVVLVSNYHQDSEDLSSLTAKGLTIMSIDADNNQEPDYAFYSNNTQDRPKIPPTRFDFVALIPMGMSSRVNNSTFYPLIPIWKPFGWFEMTETSLSMTDQFELDSGNFNTSDNDTKNYRCIINSGYFTQMVRSRDVNCSKVKYYQIGGNAYIKEFYPGSHSAKTNTTTLVPINVTGGEIEQCFMTGYGKETTDEKATAIGSDIYFWCAGGKIDKFLGAYMEKPKETSSSDGNVNMTAKIDHALIGRFFGGGTSPKAQITGDIDVTINNSKVDFYCGGPEFGDMTSGKTVTTHATGTTFGEYYGAGFGGTAITYTNDEDNTGQGIGSATKPTVDYPLSFFTNYFVKQRLKYKEGYGIGCCYKFEFLFNSRGHGSVARFYTGYAQFSLATTGNVTNELTDCMIKKLAAEETVLGKVASSGDFYGAGCQGKVNGTVTSTLTGCTVDGSAFGGGYKAESNEVDVYPVTAPTMSVYTRETGIFSDFGTVEPETFTWEQGTAEKNNKAEGSVLYSGTDITLSDLGNVTGEISITVDGGTVGGSVYGGGNESKSLDNTNVYIKSNTKIGTPGEGGAQYGNVYGGGNGKADNFEAGLVKGNTNIEISGSPTILHNVYGGGAYGSVGDFDYDATTGLPTARKAETTGGTANITITGGTIGTTGSSNGMVFGSSRGDVATPGADDIDPNDRLAWVYDTHVVIGTQSTADADPVLTTPLIKGSVYGSGENGHTFHNTVVDIHSGTIGIATGEKVTEGGVDYEGAAYPYRGNVYGGGCGTDQYTGTDDKMYYNPIAGIVRGDATVTIDGGHVVRNVYGAGAMGSVGNESEAEGESTSGKTTVTISGKAKIGVDGNDNGNVYGAARGDLAVQAENYANIRASELNIEGDADIQGSAFGGGEAGIVKESVTVNMKGGSVANDVYGGGALADTQVAYKEPANAGKNFTTHVNLTGGTVGHNVYGGGLGRLEATGVTAVEAKVYGKVLVALNGTKTEEPVEGGGTTVSYNDNCVVKGSIFGCNNQNGSPQDAVTVHIYKTQGWEGHAGTASDKKTSTNDEDHSYHLTAVYGGGNLAAYMPDTESVVDTLKTHVIIDGCGLTSIKTVYGGGDAASVPATDVLVNGTYEIEEVFGGGNGKDAITINGVTKANPGANVGYKNYSTYDAVNDEWNDNEDADTKSERLASGYVFGSGAANVTISGGTIHRVFGGSNTKGNVRITAVTMLEEAGGCEFCVDEAYGGGKEAPMDAEAKLLMACIPGLKEAYGGAEKANIEGGVTLTITNGTFDRVFGGNNISGTISGPIVVNIEETGCRPIVIGELYGGGNEAAYSVYGYKEVTEDDGEKVWKPRESATDAGTGPTTPYADPQVNVRAFTSIGSIYGGGYGTGAKMIASPTVNINESVGTPDTYPTTGDDYDTNGFKGKTITLDKGKETEHTVTLPAHKQGEIGVIGNVFGGGNAAEVKGNTTVNIGTEATQTYVSVEDDDKRVKAIKGANIVGNVYGGGNNAAVTGNTNVVIGKEM